MEERMDLYEGKTLLRCSGENMDEVIPVGDFVSATASELPFFEKRSPLVYSDFDVLLAEFWRTYDCHLFSLQNNPAALARAFGLVPASTTATRVLFSGVHFLNTDEVERERIRARRTLDRLLFTLRSSEQYLPLHASLRCLQRGGADVRNAVALISDASQCLPARLSSPETSLLK